MNGTQTKWSAPDFGLAALCFGVALILRLIFLDQAWHIPFFEHPIVDGYSYDQWATKIAGGDWWGDEVFYQAPAYPYFLGSIYALWGRDLFAAHVVQMFLGALSCALIFGATRVLFAALPDPRARLAGLAAGLMLAIYGPALFFDSLLQKAGLAQALTAAMLLCLALFQRRPRMRSAAAIGAFLAVLCLTRENALVFVPLIPVWIFVRFDEESLRRRISWSLTFAATVLALLLSVGIRNEIVGDSFVVTTSQMGSNFYIGNNEKATGLYEPLLPGRQTPRFEGSDAKLLAEKAEGRPLTPSEVSTYWMGESLDFIRSHPLHFAELLLAKTLMVTNHFEIPDTEDITIYAESSSLLRVLDTFHFGVLMPLAVLGMVLAGRRREVWILYALLAGFGSTLVLFYVMGRYRFPLVALLMPFAGFGIVEAVRFVRQREFQRLVVAATAALFVAALANLELLPEKGLRSAGYTNLGNIMLEEKRYDEAEDYLARALDLAPDNTDALLHLAVLREAQGRLAEAEQWLHQMLRLDEEDPRAHRALASLLRRLGRPEEAARHRYLGWRKRPGAPGPAPNTSGEQP